MAEIPARLQEARRHAPLSLTGTIRFVWLAGFGACVILIGAFLVAISHIFRTGIGVYGANIPIAWGSPLVNVGWWLDVGYSGLLLSALLHLTQQPWRAGVRRLSEAMALFATAIGGVFPIVHLGRPWLLFYLLPYPNTMGLWPQWRSSLIWDLSAIAAYLIYALMFIYAGLIPDLALLRDRAHSRAAQVFWGLLALGWRGSALHWARFDTAYRILAALALPLMLVVTGIDAMDYAANVIPGYHSTLLPARTVIESLYLGCALLTIMLVLLRAGSRLDEVITRRQLNGLGKLTLTFGLMVTYTYGAEAFTAWYSGDRYERFLLMVKGVGDFAAIYWSVIALTVGVLQALWLRSVRSRPWPAFIVALAILVGLWLEHYVLVFSAVHHGYVPSMWGNTSFNGWDWAMVAGSLGIMFALILIFVRILPLVSALDVHRLGGRERADG